jgi:hypothetical protein
MNFLALAQAYYRESGESFDAPASAAGASGYDGLMAGHINQAWLDIQHEARCWNWQWEPFTLDLTTVDRDYDLTDSNGATVHGLRLVRSSLTIAPSSDTTAKQDLPLLAYQKFRAREKVRRTPAAGRPNYAAVLPSGKLRIERLCDVTHRIEGELFRNPWEMTANNDEPDMPADYHWLIVYRALKEYGRYEAAAEQFNGGEAAYLAGLEKLKRDYLPDAVLHRRPLA